MNILKFRLPDNINKKEDLVITCDTSNNPISMYSDMIWNFSSQLDRKTDYGYQLHFDKTFSNGKKILHSNVMLITFKDLMYKLSYSGLKFKTLKNYFEDIFTFLNYVYIHLGVDDIKNLTESDVDGYVEYLISQDKAYNTIRAKLFVIKNGFFKYRNELDYYLLFEPFKNVNITKTVKNNSNVKKQKQTDVIPDNSWKSIINTCKSYIETYNLNLNNEDHILSSYKKELTTKNNNFRVYYTLEKVLKKKSRDIYESRITHINFIKNVQISCAMLIQAFTGMRVSELYSILRDSVISELVDVDGEEINILKIKGRTYKYVDKNNYGKEVGREVFWICPPIVEEAIKALNHINQGTLHYLSEHNLDVSKTGLFMIFQSFSNQVNFSVDKHYKKFLDEHNIKLDFEFGSHSFRRTLARFLARSLIDVPIDVIREQFKHYSKHITFYYMREDEKADIEFAELISEYVDNKDNETSKHLFSEIKAKLDNSILTARNVDELLEYVDGRKINLINEFMASVNEKPEILSPIGCLTCNGNVIIPNIHSSYWQELLVLYDEMIELEPNSIWHKQEREMVKKVVLELENNNVYITGEIK